MRIVVERDSLIKAMAFVTKHVDEKSGIPIISNVLMRATTEGLTIIGTNMDRIVGDFCAANVEAEGEACLPAHLLEKTTKLVAGSEVSIAVDGDWATIRVGKSRVKAPVLPAAEFPISEMFSQDGDCKFTVPGSLLSRLAKHVTFAREKDGGRHYLIGTSWRLYEGQIEFCATDGKRFSVMGSGIAAPDMPNILVPDFPFPEFDADVDVSISENFIRFECGRRVVVSKLTDAAFPDYRSHRLIPENATRLIFDRASLVAAINRAALVADQREHSVLIVGRSGVASVSSVTANGEASDEVTYEGDDFQTAIQYSVMSSVLASMECASVELRWSSHDVGMTAHDPEDGSRVLLMQPYRDRRLSEYVLAAAAE